jgi:hypothetical protein
MVKNLADFLTNGLRRNVTKMHRESLDQDPWAIGHNGNPTCMIGDHVKTDYSAI